MGLSPISFETAIIEQYRRRESIVEVCSSTALRAALELDIY